MPQLDVLQKMKTITKAAWDRVIHKACDVANASVMEDEPMCEVYSEQMLEILDDLEEEFGVQSLILHTRADYLDDPLERRRLYMKALELAREEKDPDQVEVVLQSLRDLDEYIELDAARSKE